MEYKILDVGAGFCAFLRFPTGETYLFDTGRSAGESLKEVLRANQVSWISRVFILNEDEDHLRGFAEVERFNTPWQRKFLVHRNRSVNRDLWEISKQTGPYQRIENAGLQAWAEWARTDEIALWDQGPNREHVTVEVYGNNAGEVAHDTNNASLLITLTVHGYKIVMPGDLETQGWENLWEGEQGAIIQESVENSDVWVAAHHGRENGYYLPALKKANPRIVVFSDKSIIHNTQANMASRYSAMCRGGLTVYRRDQGIDVFGNRDRKVLTTRNDNAISLTWVPYRGLALGAGLGGLAARDRLAGLLPATSYSMQVTIG